MKYPESMKREEALDAVKIAEQPVSAETTFTPGPWQVVTAEENGTYGMEWVDAPTALAVAYCGDAKRYKDGIPCHMYDGETKANAHLIASAPDLYLAVQNSARMASMQQKLELLQRSQMHEQADALIAEMQGMGDQIETAMRKARGGK